MSKFDLGCVLGNRKKKIQMNLGDSVTLEISEKLKTAIVVN